jgi:hypothetical protein
MDYVWYVRLASGPRGNEIDGTGVTSEVEVAIRNCEPIATFGLLWIRDAPERSDTLAADELH